MSMSRRKFLATGSAFGAAWLGASLGACATASPRAAFMASGVTRVNLGPLTVTMLADGSGSRPLDANFVRNASLADVQAALRDAGLPTDRLNITYTSPVVDIGSQRVLFDAGNGESGAATAGKLIENMNKAGIAPQSITAVVFSHFHGDHINGLRNKAGVVAFPNAKIFVPEAEWAWWMDDARMATAPESMKGAFAAPRRVFGPLASSVMRFEPGTEVLPGVRSIAAYGHTPGHTVFMVEGGAQKMMYWGDNTNVAALFVRNPDWAVAFDMDAEAARATRRKLADMVIRDRILLAGYHLPGAAIGSLVTRGNGYDFKPMAG